MAAASVRSLWRLIMVATFSGLVGAALPLFALQFQSQPDAQEMQEKFRWRSMCSCAACGGTPDCRRPRLLTAEMPDPIGSQFGIVVRRSDLRRRLRDALQAMATRWDLDDMRLVRRFTFGPERRPAAISPRSSKTCHR